MDGTLTEVSLPVQARWFWLQTLMEQPEACVWDFIPVAWNLGILPRESSAIMWDFANWASGAQRAHWSHLVARGLKPYRSDVRKQA